MNKVNRTKLLSHHEHAHRDARLFIIAPEGRETEKQYFEGLQRRAVIDRRRVVIEVISPLTGNSAPRHVLDRLSQFKARHHFHDGIDQLWLVIDHDHWGAPDHIHNLTEVIRLANDQCFNVAVSNPCFELWLLLHFTDDVSAVRAALSAHAGCKVCVERLREECGSFNKSRLRDEHYTLDRVQAAMERAQALDQQVSGQERWPQSTGTRVYLLVRELLGAPVATPARATPMRQLAPM